MHGHRRSGHSFLQSFPSPAPRTLGVLALLCGAALLAWPGDAHIVPPEELHPMAESYRRLGFVLERHPIRWSLASEDAASIAAELEAAAPGAGLDAVLPEDGEALAPALHREAAWKLFDWSTRAVAQVLEARLERAAAALGASDPLPERHRAATREFEQARGVWAAFEPTFAVADPRGFRDAGRRWLELSSALGSPGVFGVGAVEPDVATFTRQAEGLVRYVRDGLWGGAPSSIDQPEGGAAGVHLPRRDGRLLPLPVHSPTYEASSIPAAGLPPGANLNKQLPRPRQILNMATRGVDESRTPLIALGDMAFDSQAIYGEPARSLGISCNTCHNKGTINPQLIIPGLSSKHGGIDVSNNFFAPHANNALFDPLDIPDLRGVRFTAPYGRNGRFDSLREFTRNVIVNEFGGAEPDPMLLDALVAYQLEFDFLPNPYLKADGRLSDLAPEAARRGEEIFQRPFEGMGGRSCASCHVPSDHFLDRRRHDVGTALGAESFSRDRALDTPTLLGVKYTAPYFHDGRADTLAEVNAYFNAHFALGLNGAELADLTAYVETVGEGIEAYEDTLYTLEAELEEFSFFLSTYETLKARGKEDLIDITLRTVAFEIEAHKWDLQDLRHLPTLDRMTAILEAACRALEQGEVEQVDQLVASYREIYDSNREVLR